MLIGESGILKVPLLIRSCLVPDSDSDITSSSDIWIEIITSSLNFLDCVALPAPLTITIVIMFCSYGVPLRITGS